MRKKLKMLITVDTEQKGMAVPYAIECDFGVEGNCGINYIMEQLEKRKMRGVFFTNVYEHNNYHGDWEKYMEKLIERIFSRNHEVELHTHANPPVFPNMLHACSYDEQKEIIEYGTNFIKEITGKRPIAHRGGSYSCNDFTFKALYDLGYKFDSSCFYFTSGNSNQFRYYNSLNQICMIDNLIEFPVISVFDGRGTKRKFDIICLNEQELISIVEQMKSREDFEIAQFMFHSFSFIDQKGDIGAKPYFTFGTNICYGINKPLMKQFENFLDYLYNDPCIEIVTFDDLLKSGFSIPSFWGDGIFHSGTEKSKILARDYKTGRFNAKSVKGKFFSRFRDIRSIMEGGYFDRCAVIESRNCYINSKVIDAANEILNGHMLVNPQIEAIEYNISDFDWNIMSSNEPDSFQLYLQGLNPVQILVHAFDMSKDKSYLKFALRLLYSWRDYSLDDINTKNNKFIWNEYSAALRVENILYFIKTCSLSGLWNNEMFAELSKILLIHGEWLNNDKNYISNDNNGVMMDQALLYLGYVFDDNSWMENAKKRLLEQESFAFSKKEAHKGSNKSYMTRKLFYNIGHFLENINDDFSEKIFSNMKRNH